jgi:hypothetical protein
MNAAPYIGKIVHAYDPTATPQPPHYIGAGPYAALIVQDEKTGYVHLKVYMPKVVQPIDWGPVAHKDQAEPGQRYWQDIPEQR